MADTALQVNEGTGANIDTRTEATNGNHRQVVVLGDPSTNAGVAPVDASNGLSVTLTTALPAGTAAIGKLAANSGVDIGDVDVASCALPTGASTSAKQDTIIGHVDGIETLLTTIDADTSNLSTKIDTLAGAVAGTEMQVDVLTMPSVAVTNAGTFAVQAAATLSAETTKVIGTVNVSASQSIAVTQATAGNLNCTEANSGAIKNAVETIDNAISGSEMQVDVVGALPAGTNAIGKLSANSGVDIGDVDVTSLPALATGTNAIGKLLPPDIDVTAHTNYAKKYYTNAGAVTDGIVWSPAAGKRWHIVSLFVNVSAAATITFEDDLAGGDSAVLKMVLAANSGTVIPFPENYPLASGEDAADLIITTSAGNVYCSVVGYEV